MDNLIVMPRPATPTLNRVPEGGSAAILFFTGVRYLRGVEAAAFLSPLPVTPIVPRRRRVKKVAAARIEQSA